MRHYALAAICNEIYKLLLYYKQDNPERTRLKIELRGSAIELFSKSVQSRRE